MQTEPKPEPTPDRVAFCASQSELWESFAVTLTAIKNDRQQITEDQIEALARAASLCLREAEEWHARRRRLVGAGNAQPLTVKP
jgi:hypothetical protein